MSTKSTFLALVALAAASCVALPATSSPPPLAVSAQSCSQASVPDEPSLDPGFAGTPVLGGGLVKIGFFQIEAYLFCDPSLAPNADDPAQVSEVAGLGIHTAWRYSGPSLPGNVEELRGFAQPSATSGWDGGLTPGSMGTYTGGVRTEDYDIASSLLLGAPAPYYIVVRVCGEQVSAALSFSARSATDGYVLADFALQPGP